MKNLILNNSACEIFVLDTQILFWKYKAETYVELIDFLEMLDCTKTYIRSNGKCHFIVEAPATMNFNIDTWQYIKETNYEDEIAVSVAMYTSGLQHNLMAKSYERKVVPKTLFNVLSNFDESLLWIKSQLKQHAALSQSCL
jgi:hypothetical protein